ncbi:hypothetical protein Q5424_07545 [Conexibacter sp. JD483]|uniref:hypothetical protein n=1 Tax=unclassified Conexibacter TaxID=2627773 RepID=UPI0027260A09|nr:MULTISPECIES: hypothetical protein [unclassified Conexibacter]MDO8186047.1 hypothetical protein [Conexibacter sp. CPCC 205706]MDO8199537.1 hypothetical protein [Conexibacter sp. CPCC 205762]MDR9368928.1 hypothetical protein [Conexibacter sp. JD483]
MARRRGFWAELQYQNQLAARQREREARARARAHAAAVREAERAQRQAERAAVAAGRAREAERKAAQREAKRLHEQYRQAEVEALNTALAETAEDLSSVLAATLDVDDFVDLETLRVTARHPPFLRSDLEVPTPEVVPVTAPPEPQFVEPEPPRGIGSVFGGKKKHAAAVAAAREAFEEAHRAWQAEAARVPALQLEQMQQRDAREHQRLAALRAAQEQYRSECHAREAEAAEANESLDALIRGLSAGEDAAVDEYVGIVLGNSVYPEVLEVAHDYRFDAESRELVLTVLIGAPDRLPVEKSFRWVRARDEIIATALSRKDLKERYAGVVHQVALRTLHEIFEADREGRIQTISLHVATETKDPATGLERRVDFVGVGAERDSFIEFDLHNIVPAATLEHLGAALSRNPYDLVGIDTAPGVRGR